MSTGTATTNGTAGTLAPRAVGLLGVVLLVAGTVLRFTAPGDTFDRVTTALMLLCGVVLGWALLRAEARAGSNLWRDALTAVTLALLTLSMGVDAHWPQSGWNKALSVLVLPCALVMLYLSVRGGRSRR